MAVEVSSPEDVRTATVRVWDPPTRIFHWSLVFLVATNIYTGSVGGLWEMDMHMLSGYAILTLVGFRLVWGFVGSRHSRFTSFIRGPRRVIEYARALYSGRPVSYLGHNPLGGLSVLAMLISLFIQALTGLFANDDILTEGPLARTVSKATSDALSAVHEANANLLFVLIGIHILAVLGYLFAKGENLIRPMFTGRKTAVSAPEDKDATFVSTGWAAVVLAGSAGLVYLVVSAPKLF